MRRSYGATAFNGLTAIECVQVFKSFGSHRVLDGVSCAVPRGQITVIMGPSGTGKSVLLRHFVGLLMPDAGDVIVMGTPSGVGYGRKPPVYMKPGDVCEVSIERIATLRNEVVQEA